MRFNSVNSKTDEIIKDVINKELELVGANIRLDDIIKSNDNNWFDRYTLNLQQYLELEKYFKERVKKFRWNKRQIRDEFSYVMLDYGLRFDDEVYSHIFGEI